MYSVCGSLGAMRRVTAFVVALIVCSTGVLAGAQPARRLPVLAVLEPGPEGRPGAASLVFKEKLRELGWEDGRNLTIEIRYGDWKSDRLPSLAADLVRLNPDLLWTHSTGGAQAAKQATSTIPVVIGVAGDLVGQGIVKSLARPGGNITGMTLLSPQIEPKRLELLRETVPKLSRVAVLGYAAMPPSHPLVEAAHAMTIQLRRITVRAPHEIDIALETMARDGAQAVLVEDAAMHSANVQRIADLAIKHRLPSMSQVPGFAEAGGLLQYGALASDLARRSAFLVDKILKGAKPGDLPVEQASTFQLIVNLKTARILGLTIPPSVRARADRVVQ